MKIQTRGLASRRYTLNATFGSLAWRSGPDRDGGDPPRRFLCEDATQTVDEEHARLERLAFRAIISQTASGLSWTAVALLVGFVTKMLLTRKVPPAELGIVLAAQSFIGLILALTEIGIPDAVVRHIGMDATAGMAPRRTVYAAVSVVAPATALAAALMTAGLWTWFGRHMSVDALWATTLLFLTLPLLAVGNVIGAAYRGVSRLGTKLLMVDVARPGVVAVALALSPPVLTRQAAYVAVLYAGAAFITLAGLWVLFGRDRRWTSGRGTTSSDLLRFGVPIAGAAVIAGPLVNSLLPLMLTSWTGPTAVALFAIALSLQAIVYLPIAVFEQAVVPAWSRMAVHASARDILKSYTHFSHICFASAASLGLVMIANDTTILVFLFGPAYAAASWALRCVVIATLFGAFTGPNEAMLRAFGLTGSIFNARMAAAVVGVTAGLILIPDYGLSGAVVAFAGVSVTINALYGLTLYSKTGVHPFTWRHSVTMTMATGGVLTATLGAGSYPVAAWVVVHVLAFLVVVSNVNLRLAIRQLVTP